MSSELQQSTLAIISQQKMIQQNRNNRNQIYQSCMDNYLNHLKKQMHQLQASQEVNQQRNNQISQAFQTVYQKIITSSNLTIRKIKQTSYQKKLFWQNLIKDNVQLNDIELKKSFYFQKRDAQDRYQEAIQQQKNKKIPYTVLLGKNKTKQGLKHYQHNNRVFQDKVNQGTATLNHWRINRPTNSTQAQNLYKPIHQVYDHHQVRNQFQRTNNNLNIRQNTGKITSGFQNSAYQGELDFLKNFEKKK